MHTSGKFRIEFLALLLNPQLPSCALYNPCCYAGPIKDGICSRHILHLSLIIRHLIRMNIGAVKLTTLAVQ